VIQFLKVPRVTIVYRFDCTFVMTCAGRLRPKSVAFAGKKGWGKNGKKGWEKNGKKGWEKNGSICKDREITFSTTTTIIIKAVTITLSLFFSK